MRLIVGLGNPGKRYEKTRHNIGFLILDQLAQDKGTNWKKEDKLRAEIAEIKIGREKAILLKPQTFMNRSGESVQAALNYFKITSDKLTVVHDDADLDFGNIKLQAGRSAAGHNGVQSIIDYLGGENKFIRLRVGIGRGENNEPLDVYVLNKWDKKQNQLLVNLIAESCLRLTDV